MCTFKYSLSVHTASTHTPDSRVQWPSQVQPLLGHSPACRYTVWPQLCGRDKGVPPHNLPPHELDTSLQTDLRGPINLS